MMMHKSLNRREGVQALFGASVPLQKINGRFSR